ncbi:MAG: universal stress protein [Mycobacterium sp.]|nr:universal stress protein [Mycobacterium sp.]
MSAMKVDQTGAADPVVVGVDGSEVSAGAARWAAAVAEKYHRPLRIVHAEPYLGRAFSDAAAAIQAAALAGDRQRAEVILADAEKSVHSEFAALEVTTAALPEPADRALPRAGDGAALLVVGCDDVTPAGALLIGSTTLQTVIHAQCPVVAWRGRRSRPTAEPVVVGVGGREFDTALAAAFAFADRFGSPLRAVRAWSGHLPIGDIIVADSADSAGPEAVQRDELAAAVEPWQRRYPGVEVSLVLEPAKPSLALLTHAADAQLVVIASRGRNVLLSSVIGSTGLNLLHHSPVPVMLCRQGRDTATTQKGTP